MRYYHLPASVGFKTGTKPISATDRLCVAYIFSRIRRESIPLWNTDRIAWTRRCVRLAVMLYKIFGHDFTKEVQKIENRMNRGWILKGKK